MDVINLQVHLAEGGARVASASRQEDRRLQAERSLAVAGKLRSLSAVAAQATEQADIKEQTKPERVPGRFPGAVSEVASAIPGFDTRLLGAGGFAGAVAGAAGAAVGFGLAVGRANKVVDDLAQSRGIYGAQQATAEQAGLLAADRINLTRLPLKEAYAQRQAAQLGGLGGGGRLDALNRSLITTQLPGAFELTGQYQSLFDFDKIGNVQRAGERAAVNVTMNVLGSVIAEADLKDRLVAATREALRTGSLTDGINAALGVR